MFVVIHIVVVVLALAGAAFWCVRRITLLRMTRWDLLEASNSPAFIIKTDGTVLSYRNALRNRDKTVVNKMAESEKNVYDWLDEASRRTLRAAVHVLMQTRERQDLHLGFLNGLAHNEVHLVWYGPHTFAFLIDMPSVEKGELHQLKSESHLMGAVLDNLPIATTVEDLSNRHRFLVANKRASELYGVDGAQLVGHTIPSFSPDIQEAWMCCDQLMERDGRADLIQSVALPDGTKRTLSFHKVLVPNLEGEKVWAITTAADISDIVAQQATITEGQRQLDEARQKAEDSLRLKEEFLHNISLEVRTPLTAIMGFASLLVESTDENERNELARIISINGDILLAQIEDMIQLSQIESGNIELHLREIGLNTLVEECVAEGHWIDKPQLTYAKVLPERRYRAVIDRRQVRVILRQLISNAIKFTDTGHVEVGYDVADGSVRFHVSDTGIGIAPENQTRVFDRFEKLGSLRPGVGLGLSICRALVLKMNGQIGVESELGKGTTVWFSLPCHVTETPVDESTTVSRLWDQLITVRTQRG